MKKSALFKREEVFSQSYVPPRLVGREEETELLREVFLSAKKGTTHTVSIEGGVGVGKTHLVKYVGREMNEIRPVHLFVYPREPPHCLLFRLIKHFEPGFPSRGYSYHEILHILPKVIERPTVIVLDGAEQLHPELTQMMAEYAQEGRYSVIFVGRKPLDLETDMRIHLSPYDEEEIAEILEDRVREGVKEGVVGRSAIDYISQLVGPGGARLPIQVLWGSVIKAAVRGYDEVTADVVRETWWMRRSSGMPEITSLPQLIILKAAIEASRWECSPYVSRRELRNAYGEICSRLRLNPNRFPFDETLEGLVKIGMILMRGNSIALIPPLRSLEGKVHKKLEEILGEEIGEAGI